MELYHRSSVQPALNRTLSWQAEHRGELREAGSTQNASQGGLVALIPSGFFPGKAWSGGEPFVFEEELTCLGRWHFLQMLPTRLDWFQLKLKRRDTYRVIVLICNDFAMWCTHSTELKTNSLWMLVRLCTRTPVLVSFTWEASEIQRFPFIRASTNSVGSNFRKWLSLVTPHWIRNCYLSRVCAGDAKAHTQQLPWCCF